MVTTQLCCFEKIDVDYFDESKRFATYPSNLFPSSSRFVLVREQIDSNTTESHKNWTGASQPAYSFSCLQLPENNLGNSNPLLILTNWPRQKGLYAQCLRYMYH